MTNMKLFIILPIDIYIGILILISAFIISYVFSAKIISLAYSYDQPVDLIKRAIVLITSIMLILFINKIYTNKKTILTKIGKNSYAVYILHTFIITFIDSRIIRPLLPAGELYLLFSIVSAIIIVYILSRDFVTRIFNKIIESTCNIII